MVNYNEAIIIEQLRNKATQREAFSQIVNHYTKQLYQQVRHLVLDHDQTNDILQNTFIKAWLNIDYFRGDAKLSTWLYKIALNESLTFLKKENRTTSLDEGDGQYLTQLKSDSYFSGDQAQIQLQKAIHQLPSKQRIVFNLKYYQEMKYEAMSEITGTTVGALKASYHHAVLKIKKHLESLN
ncbi:MAG: RNA polymerase sigma factor [Bacteroidaceae bacterium]